MSLLKEKIQLLPHSPGVYRFYDANGTIIYIGKAKDLKKRVSQYFTSIDKKYGKTKALVSKIFNLEHTVVETEEDALLLENNLIKQYQPKYNIMLKDSKSYPWICIKNESFPKVFLTRRLIKDGSLYFGPYSSVGHAYKLLALINSLFQLRTCNLALNSQNIHSQKFKACLNFHIKKCAGPCIAGISEEVYNAQISSIKEILKGNVASLVREYKDKMSILAKELNFEQAHYYKEKIELLNNHYSKSLIVNASISKLDIFSIVFDKNRAFGNFMRINAGCIIQTFNMEFKLNIEEEASAVLSNFIIEAYNVLKPEQSPSNEIIVPFMPQELNIGKQIHIPLRGDKAALLELSTKNANAFKFERLKQEELKNPQEQKNTALVKLKEELKLSHLPLHIECFDNSNTMGTFPVSACVVFKNGKPSKRDYRHFNVKTVVGANDYATMREVVFRRYSRLIEEGADLPQLILVDGGKGQLAFAYDALVELGISDKIDIIGIAERMEEIISPKLSSSILLGKNSPSLRILMHLRDEAHRFGITHHRKKRTKAQIDSALIDIKGIGEQTQEKLLQHFKSVKRIKAASIEELTALIGLKKAKLVKEELL